MWPLIVVCAVVCYVSADVIPGGVKFNKCCPKNQSLIYMLDAEDSVSAYQCIDHNNAINRFNISISPLIVGEHVSLQYGIPTDCDELQMAQMTLNNGLKDLKENCYDRLELEVVNGTLKPYIPKIVALSCVKNETQNSSALSLVHQMRKCCPKGESYDSTYHICRKTSTDNTEDWLLNRLKLKDYIYEVDNGLVCKSGEYGVELREDFFSFDVDGSKLNVLRSEEGVDDQVLPGEWCLDRSYTSQSLVARVCTRDCAKYGAFCLRKCCPIGYHYRPRRCGSFASRCAANEDELLFNIADYLEPLQRDETHITGKY